MTLIELIIFLFLCFVIGFVGHLVSTRWGWLIGVIPAFAIIIAMLFFQVRSMFVALWNAVSRRAGK
jgi:hypothetical protein